MPADSDDRTWRKLKENLDQRLDENRTPTATGDDYWTPDNIKAATSGIPVLDPKEAPPASKAEAEAATDYISYLADGYPADALTHKLDAMALRYAMRPYRVTGDYSWMYGENEYPARLSRETKKARLKEHLKQLRMMLRNLGNPTEGIQQRALYLLTVDDSRLTAAPKIGWQNQTELDRPDTFKNTLAYLANPKPQPLKVLGTTVSFSPTKLGLYLEKRRLAKKWVQVFESIKDLPWEEQMLQIQVQRDDLPLTGTIEHTFWNDLLNWRAVPKEIAGAKLCQLVIVLKLYEIDNGSLPTSLSAVSSEVDFPEELKSNFIWDAKTKTLKSTETDLTAKLGES